VLIPVHRAHPTHLERISLRQCGRCLPGRDFVVLASRGLDIGAYRELLPGAREIRVEPSWMGSRAAYNRLMIAPLVYDRLSGRSHILVHEPDSLVLRDELDHWCRQPFDYIGAPWFEGFSDPAPHAAPIGVGNFGLSLLRVDAVRAALTSRQRWQPLTARMRRGLQAIRARGQLRSTWRFYDGHCDIFWSAVVPTLVPSFRVAPIAAALRFSWEVLPARCFELTGGQLPFGFHAWARYDRDFLLPHLKQSGVDLGPLDAIRA
jgi:hypothetical protein